MRAQIGIEIIGIVGFIFIILIPLFMGLYTYSNSFFERLSLEKADMAAERMANMANMVGVQGDAMLTQEIIIPDNIQEINIRGNEVAFKLLTSSGETEVVKRTEYNVSASFSSLGKGSYRIKAEARKGVVTLELR